MVLRTKTEILCGVCARSDVDREATTSEDVTVGNVTRHIDLCEEHAPELVRLLVFLEVNGEEPETVKKAGFGCNFCAGVFPTRQQRNVHVRDDHRGYGQLKAAEKIEVGERVG